MSLVEQFSLLELLERQPSLRSQDSLAFSPDHIWLYEYESSVPKMKTPIMLIFHIPSMIGFEPCHPSQLYVQLSQSIQRR